MNCYFWVPIPQGKALKIVFDYFNLESHSFCGYDYLRIRNDMGVTYGKYCGVHSGKTVLVTGSRASFHFHSETSVQKKGFRLYLSIVSSAATVAPSTQPPAPTTYPACPQLINNTLESPGYPSYFSQGMDCNISVPIPLGANMRVFFQVFFIYRSGWSCWYRGFLDIMNENGDSFGQYCGNQNGRAVLVNGSFVVLRFRPGYYASYGRFRLFFTPVNATPPTTMNATVNVTSSGCRGQLKVYNNFVESPGYPFRYPNNMNCYFWVPIPQGKALKVVFDYFNLESHSSCGWDYLRIRNDKGFTYGKYCGVQSGKNFLVTGSRAGFHFHSDSSVQRRGFRLHFSTVSLGQFKKRAQLDVAKGKRQVEDQKLAKKREESIHKNLFKEDKKGR
ncbi:PREDICTED: tolloid-like protein 2 [Acropora digitifera]|uniref:tolloid-like protein 2 n=1 Tax=Acropora digitifera TaxID=70779 RepID=UPI00077AB44B|nr:PREDICTED: tolloid-like protein 2 [Acropora digitifera]